MKGKGRFGDSEGHRIIGTKGGKATFEKHGKEHYQRIGKKGGSKSKKKEVII